MHVRDEGIGMEPGELSELFDPFVQARPSLASSPAGGGLGLGLALSKGLVELHGGTLQARSEGRGRGSEFCLTLPMMHAPASSTAVITTGKAQRSCVVLVIEDNFDGSLALSAALEHMGHRVFTAHDGKTGIATAHELKPDVVLCDIGLPDVDGYDVARALKRDERLRATHLIALSGYAQPEDHLLAAKAGFDAHLAKPLEMAELAAMLASL